MADEVGSPFQATARPPISSPQSASLLELHDQGEFKENVYKKPLPTMPHVPTSNSGRIHDAPMAPIKPNVQSEAWAPRTSPAKIDGTMSHTAAIRVVTTFQDEQYSSNDSSDQAVVQNMPHRQHYTTHDAGPLQQPQAAVLSSPRKQSQDFSYSDTSQNQDHLMGNIPSPVSRDPASSTEIPSVQPLQYHHQQLLADETPAAAVQSGVEINRHLTPTTLHGRRSGILRPNSAYSASSDPDSRARSPGHRSPSGNLAARSPDARPLSYIDLLSVPYPQPPPVPLSLDNSQLRTAVGSNASLLSTAKTLEMYRMNVKKTNDPSVQYAFAVFLIAAAQEAGLNESMTELDNSRSERVDSPSSSQDLLREARQILQKLADRSYPFAQYYLADGYASGILNKGREDYDRAFPLFVAASKHGHAESGYRAALCYEFGWGSKKDLAKAVQFYRQSASKNHPGAMTRLGRACLTGELGLNKYREGIKWLKRATEAADRQYNAAPYHLGLLYETGYGDDIFKDETYAAQLFTQAADLDHAEASYRLGDAYEHGKLSCPRDSALSVHFYTGAAQKNHPAAMMALCAWYLVGAEPILEKDENEAYEWARRAAECGLTKAEYAVGYFTEMGIGCRRDPLEANVWYVRAADAGDERAKHRLAAIRAAISGADPVDAADPKRRMRKKKSLGRIDGKVKIAATGTAGGGEGTSPKSPKDDRDCIVM